MKKSLVVIFILLILLILLVVFYKYFRLDYLDSDNKHNEEEMIALVISKKDNLISLMDKFDIIYTFDENIINANLGDKLIIKYKKDLDDKMEIISYNLQEEDSDFLVYDDKGIFNTYYKMAYNKLNGLSLDEKIGQLVLARYPKKDVIDNLLKYKLGGYVFFANDFKNKSELEVKEMINNLQLSSSIPLITSVDEEGGKVVRISSNNNLVKEKFKSSRELYLLGGMDKIREDTINKSKVLFNLGLNVNLAPVVDVSMNVDDYMYERSIGEDVKITSLYSETVINASSGLGVSYVLKHFPGYGNNTDTHKDSAIDNRSYESILENDLPPFKRGIEEGAEAIMISHNIVSSIDSSNPASLSTNIHNLLRDKLKFTGIIITDDLYMGATLKIEDASVKAVLAGNNLLITTDYINSINSIKNAINEGVISEKLIDKLAFKVLAWKYYKGLMINVK